MLFVHSLRVLKPFPSRRFVSSRFSVRSMHVVQRSIELTPSERALFDVLQGTKKHYELDVTLRCAGGWVRDKLLGKHSDDIDVALDKMLGAEFAEKVNGYLKHQGENVHPVAVIETNPEQSKHLETARVKIHGLQIDLVNLRSETYSQTSRVPQMEFGSPSEDAHRRDLTINSLFYNVDTSQVEDFTGKGMKDLEKGWIRTPLPPLETFLDDPLRVLRAIRFAARFSFCLDPELKEAIKKAEVQQALQTKISRERIGTEIDGMFKGPDPLTAVRHLVDLSLFSIVFCLPETIHLANYPERCLETFEAAIQIMEDRKPKCSIEERRLFLLAALLLPLRTTKIPTGSKGATRTFFLKATVSLGLRWKNKDSRDVELLHEQIVNLLQFYRQRIAPEIDDSNLDPLERHPRVQLGMWVRKLKTLWKIGVLLAPLCLTEAAASDLDDQIDLEIINESLHTLNEGQRFTRTRLCQDLENWILALEVEAAWTLQPMLNGKMIMQELEMTQGGPQLGILSERLLKWQLANPKGAYEDIVLFLKNEQKTWRNLVH